MTIKNILILVTEMTIVIIAMTVVLVWLAQRDVELMEWATLYEDCVMVEYNTTPTVYYNENGEYPECEVELNEE